ncbi:MAG: hypothetical protein EOP32_41330 [Rhodococcus sp. (in: high G+C Gram-positive bacteria)]|nr:MAG: hypothetical protein EOP32_41330 [Rhodococcus sp. (in: high G+C Gram-positive bacteria)]
MAAVRLLIAREQHRTPHAKVIVLNRQRAWFNERHRHDRGPDPDPACHAIAGARFRGEPAPSDC